MSESRLDIYDPNRSELTVMPSTARQVVTSGHLRMPSVDELSVMSTLAKAISGSGMYPGFTTESQAMAGMLLAYDLRRPFSQVFRNAYMIEGRLSLAAQYIAGLVMDAPGCELRVTEQTAEQCTVTFRRPGWASEQTFTYTMADAKKAQLDGKAIWKKYPREMLANRAFAVVARTHFPDVAAGMYTPDEVEDFESRPPMTARTSETLATIDAQFSPETPATPALGASDERQRASDALHAAGGTYGMDHEDIRRFIAERSGKPEAELSSMTEWDVRQFRWAKLQVDRFAREWVQTQEQGDSIDAEATVVDSVDTDDDMEIDPETGEVIPTVFPAVHASLLTDADEQAPRRNPDAWTN
jgi:hypothetical protein